MKLPRSSGKLKKSKPFLIRRVVGQSMTPTLAAGQIIIVSGWLFRAREGEVVIVRHGGVEKIKRIEEKRADGSVYVLGDNLNASTDSRSFGWIPRKAILGKVIWPQVNN